MFAALSLSLSLLFGVSGPPPQAAPTAEVEPVSEPAPRPSFEELRGFKTVLLNEVNRLIGSESLPASMGYPVEPGVYVLANKKAISVFDLFSLPLNAGRAVDATPAPACKSGCPRQFFDGFRFIWLGLVEEARSLDTDVPSRVLFGVDAKLPAATLVQMAYAMAESRPLQPPTMYLLLNSGQAGLRARPFFLIPPKGLPRRPGDRLLGLRVRMEAGGKFTVSALHPSFGRTVKAQGPEQLRAILKDIQRRFPGKDVLILEASETAAVSDIASVMTASKDTFGKIVLTAKGA